MSFHVISCHPPCTPCSTPSRHPQDPCCVYDHHTPPPRRLPHGIHLTTSSKLLIFFFNTYLTTWNGWAWVGVKPIYRRNRGLQGALQGGAQGRHRGRHRATSTDINRPRAKPTRLKNMPHPIDTWTIMCHNNNVTRRKKRRRATPYYYNWKGD